MMAVAGSMNGLIAYGIQIHLNHLNGWLAWRWLFLIEGKKKKKNNEAAEALQS